MEEQGNTKNQKEQRNFIPLKKSGLALPEIRVRGASWVHYLLWGLLILIVVFSFVNIRWPQHLWKHFHFVDYPLHSTIESLGAIAAILIAIMPLQILFGKSRPSYIFLSGAFLVMGLMDFFHSFYEEGHGFVFTHAIALLAGGFFFALFVFPWRINPDKAKGYLLTVLGLVTILFGILTSQDRAMFPEMVHDGVFTTAANNVNVIAGVLFLISSVKLVGIYFREKNLGILILLFTAVISAIVGITFQYSSPWSDSWWLWHTLRLIAFLAVLGYMFWRIQAVGKERNEALQSIEESHKQLMASEERFSLVSEATKHGLWDWNVPENKVYFSPVWKAQVGYKEDELENDFDNWVKLLHPEDKERCLKVVEDFLKDPKEKFILEFRFRHKDGHYIWIHNQAAAVRDEDGNVLRMFGAHTDITVQKEAEEKLRESEKQFRIIFENSPLGKSRTGLDGTLNINKAFSDITGYSQDELQKRDWREITHPDDIEESEEVIQTLLSGERESARFVKRYLHSKGHYVWTEVTTTLHRNETGEPQFFITTISDISRQKEAEKKLLESEKKYRTLTESSQDQIFTIGKDFRVLYVNKRAAESFRKSPDEITGKHLEEIFPPQIAKQQIESISEVIRSGQPDSRVSESVFPHKTVWLDTALIPLKNINGETEAVMGVSRDVSAQKAAERKIRESEEKFRNLFNSVSIPLCHVKEDGRIESINSRFIEHLGYTIEDIPTIDDWWENAYPDEEYRKWVIENWEQAVEASIKNKTDIESDVYSVSCKNGEQRQMVIAGIALEKDVLATFIDVTEQQRAEEAIIKEKEFTDSVINAMPGIFYLFDQNGKFLKWNNTLADLSGLSFEEVGTKSPFDFIAPSHREKVGEAIQTSFTEGSVLVEADFLAKGKASVPFLFTGKRIIRDNEPLLVGIGIDITQRLQAEQEKEKALYNLNERMKEITCLFEINEAIKDKSVGVSEVMERITRIIPKGWHYPEKTSVRITLDGKEYRSKDQRSSVEYLKEELIIDGQKRGFLQIFVFDLDSEQSELPFLKEEKRLAKSIADNLSIYISRIESEEAIRESESNFRNVYSNSPVSIWQEDWTEIIHMINGLKKEGIKDFETYFKENKPYVNEALTKVVINDVNQATLEMFEAEDKDELVKSLEVVFATEDTLPGFIGELVALAEGKQVYETEMKLNTAKGNLINTMLRMSFPPEDVDDGLVLVSIMDISELKTAQEQLRVSMEDLQRSNKELERFAYVASHDLQEPLRMVSSYTQLLERRYKGQLDERADKYIHYAVDGANRMQNLINDLLSFSRISTRGEKFSKTDVNRVVENVSKDLSMSIEETGAKIEVGKMPVIKADTGQIERLFLNLLGNALKFRKEGEKPLIRINATEKKDEWLFSVADNGIGIDEKFKEKVFVIFQRLHGAAQYKGTGIGLAICKRIVQRHGGEIWFESEGNKGTTFYFTLKKLSLQANSN